MLTIAIGKTVGLLALLHLSVGCRCHYIRYGQNESFGRRNGSPSQKTVQICGSKLTSLITSLCDGYLASPNEESDEAFNYGSKSLNFDRNGVVEKCCKNPCDRDFLLQHCNESKSNLTTIFQEMKDVGKRTNELTDRVREMRLFKEGTETRRPRNKTGNTGRAGNEIDKVRLKEEKKKERKKKFKTVKKGRMKRKPHLMWEKIYKSFGHYLLQLDHDVKVPTKISKRHNILVQRIEVGTISPINLGGDPVVVPSRHRSANYHRG